MPSAQKDPQDYDLVPITDKELIHYTRQQNAASWKGHLSCEDYVIREHVLSLSPLAKGLKVFVFVEKSKPKVPLCSMEILFRRSWKYDGEGRRQNVQMATIGGVYTYPENRGQGYARIMIDKAVSYIRKFAGVDSFTILYSEVGEYYSRNGFTSLPVDYLEIPLKTTQSNTNKAQSVVLNNEVVTPIQYQDFGPFFEKYGEAVDDWIKKEISVDGKSRVCLTPTSDLIDWFHLRSKYLSFMMFHPNKSFDFLNSTYSEITKAFDDIEPQIFGLQLKNSSTNEFIGFISWYYEWYTDEQTNEFKTKVTVISLHVDPSYNKREYSFKLVHLLKEFLEEEPSNGTLQPMGKLVIWELELVDPTVKNAILELFSGSKGGLENGSRSAILFNNEKDRELFSRGKLVWELNTKLPWF
ncbi:uncharacterized protein KQ657_001846 [Scheffersomyces spartinae]|uniref:LYC1 C-terminal domain-containing protein n=1 Tax=Scheffersomyces spartinae TaxID=45513 RepID=A0A9P8AGK0_9ASCO|nr:uncharacterized protein KQ657_001846 [Scheffersomyces spartinae]KAG7192445.1 hypothetical protein KQ657_001846 [Scheffersomyces spartinae]